MGFKTLKVKISRNEHTLQCWLLMALPIIGFFVFTLYPLLWAFSKGFYYYDGSAITQRFVGFENFIAAFKDINYWKSWLTTLQFTFIKIPIEITISLFVALLLHRNLKGKGFFRALFYFPTVISVAIVAMTFSSMFDYFGFVNAWLTKLGIIQEGIEWFSTKWRAMTVLQIGGIWSSFGINVLYFIASFANVSEDVYEAAKIDGASSRVTFFKITLPMIASVFRVILLLSINGTLHVNDYIIAMTGGGPAGSTYSVMAYLVGNYVPGFSNPGVNVGYGSCLATITAILMGLIALVYSKLSAKMEQM